MLLIHCDPDVKQSRAIWFWTLSALWLLWIFNLAADSYAIASIEDLQGAAHGEWRADPRDVRTGVMIRGFVALILVFVFAHFIAKGQAALVRSVKETFRLRRSQPATRVPQMQHSFAVTIKKKKTNKQKSNPKP